MAEWESASQQITLIEKCSADINAILVDITDATTAIMDVLGCPVSVAKCTADIAKASVKMIYPNLTPSFTIGNG